MVVLVGMLVVMVVCLVVGAVCFGGIDDLVMAGARGSCTEVNSLFPDARMHVPSLGAIGIVESTK
jgi:hypothetical protein